MMKATDSQQLHQRLWEAASRGDSAAVRMLAMNGVDVDVRNPDGFTAYNLATRNGHYNTALIILTARQMKYLGQAGQGLTQDLTAASTARRA